MKKALKWIGIIFVALVVLGALFGGNDDTKPTSTNAPGASVPAPAPPPEITKEGTASDVKFVVNSSKTAATIGKNQFATVKANGIFKIIEVSVTNNQKDAITMDGSLFKLYDDQNREFKASSEAILAIEVDNKSSLFLKEINPGLTVKGTIAFDVPPDAKGFKLKARGGMTGKEITLKVD